MRKICTELEKEQAGFDVVTMASTNDFVSQKSLKSSRRRQSIDEV